MAVDLIADHEIAACIQVFQICRGHVPGSSIQARRDDVGSQLGPDSCQLVRIPSVAQKAVVGAKADRRAGLAVQIGPRIELVSSGAIYL